MEFIKINVKYATFTTNCWGGVWFTHSQLFRETIQPRVVMGWVLGGGLGGGVGGGVGGVVGGVDGDVVGGVDGGVPYCFIVP